MKYSLLNGSSRPLLYRKPGYYFMGRMRARIKPCVKNVALTQYHGWSPMNFF
jgi:hypothetical protein